MVSGDARASDPLFNSVLVVEPVAYLKQIVANFLRGAGVSHVHACNTPVEALRMITLHGCDLVLCGSDHGAGFALAKALRWGNDTPNRGISFILMEKMASPTSIAKARDIGIDAVLAIPFSGNALVQRVKSLSTARPELIVTENYVGPDRRKVDLPIHHPDRRTGVMMPEPSFEKSNRDLLLEHIRSRKKEKPRREGANASVVLSKTTPAKKPDIATGGDIPCTVSELEPGTSLARACVTKAGITVVTAFQPLSERSILRLTDMVRAGELDDSFFVAI